jgi:hypothetical protein
MTLAAIRFFIMWLAFSTLPAFIIISCNLEKSEFSKLEKYYTKNTQLHSEIFDSLITFCKLNHTDVVLRKSNYKESAIAFRIHFISESELTPVFFDSALKRHDPYPGKTMKYIIPLATIKKFSESIYNAISADSTQTFFGGAWDVKFQLGTQGDSQYGILLSTEQTITNKCLKRLSSNACLTTGTIP